LEDGDLHERGELRLHAVPDPLREILARRVLEPRDLVEVVMIELVPERLPDVVDHAVVDEPTRLRIHRTGDRELDLERVPVQALALVTFRDVRKLVGRLETELVYQANVHGTRSIALLPSTE